MLNYIRFKKIKLWLGIVVLMLVFSTAEAQKKNILFFGDSITAGHGIDPQKAFPALIQQKIDSLGWDFNVINGGLSGETSAGGLRRINWMLKKKVSVFVLELGGNDALRGVDLNTTKKNLQQIIDGVHQTYPDAAIVLAGMQVPPNLGSDYTQKFKKMYPQLARQNDIVLIPFLLKDVGGKPSLNQPDMIHPTAEGHAILAETVWKALKPVLQRIRIKS